MLQLGHLLAAGMAMFCFFRAKDLGLEASTLGGLTWMGNSFAASWLEFEGVVTAAMYLPLLLAGFEYTLSRSSRWWFAIAALSALCLLGGDIQANSLTLVIFTAYVFIRAVSLKAVTPLLWGVVAAVLALLLSAPEWLSLLQLWSESSAGPTVIASGSGGAR